MWPFSKKYSIVSSGLLQGATDWHSHILPDVDDGIRSMKDALAVLARYEDLGIREVWLTPHIMEDIPNTTDHLRERFAELQDAYKGSVQLHLAAENMLDTLFEERLEAGDLLPIGPKADHLLVETSYFNPPLDLYGLLDKIISKGFRPILAHPERYTYMTMADYRRLKEKGVLFQMNITSLVGAYGGESRQKVGMLLSEHWINFLGSDIHRLLSFNRAIEAKVLEKRTLQLLA